MRDVTAYIHGPDCPLGGMEDTVPCSICDLIARVCADVAEQIAQAIEAEATHPCESYDRSCACGACESYDSYRHAARIARRIGGAQ